MKFIGDNPSSRYDAFNFNGANIFLDKTDFNNETGQNAIKFCQLHGYTFNGREISAVYYLRGNRHKVGFDQVLVGILEAETLPRELNEIVHCLTFWNQEGIDCYNMNKADKETYRDFILRCIACDCRVFVEPSADQFTTGREGNLIWVNNKITNDRILTIHF